MKSKELQAQSMELLKTNEQLLENEQRYSALFNAKTNAIAHCRVLIDEHGEPVDYIILQVNGAYEEITGIEKANIEGKTATDACLGIEHLTYDHIGNFGKVALEGCELNIEVFLETCQRWLSIYVYSPKLCELTVIFTDAEPIESRWLRCCRKAKSDSVLWLIQSQNWLGSLIQMAISTGITSIGTLILAQL